MKDSDLLFNILTAAAFGVVIILAPTTSRAAADEASGLYIGAGVGQSDVDTSCAVPGGVTTSCDTTNTAWKAYLGYQFNKWIGLEGGYVKFGDVNASGLVGSTPVSAQTQTWGVPVYAVGSIPIPLDSAGKYKISVLGKLGAIYWDQQRNSSLPGNSGSGTGWDFAWGAGVQLTLSEHLGIRGEWEKFINVGNSATGQNDIQMWTVGLNYKF
jgi:opacity protein-like surface antigen